MRKSGLFSTLRRVFGFVKKHTVPVIASMLLTLLSVALTLYLPIVIGRAIDCIIGKGNVDFVRIGGLLAEAAAIAVATAALLWLSEVLNTRVAYKTVRDVRRAAFDKIGKLPLSYMDSHRTGDIVSRVISDAERFADGMLMGFSSLFSGILTIIGTLVFMLTIEWHVALVVVVFTPLSLLISKFISGKTYTFFRLQSESRAEQVAQVDELVGNLKTVKAFSHERKSISDFDKLNTELSKRSLRAIFFSSVVNPSTRFINNLVYAGVGGVGAVILCGGGSAGFTVGALSCLLSYANRYAKPFNEISGIFAELQNALACADRIFDLIDEKPESDDSAGKVLQNVSGRVSIDSVSFSYNKNKKLIEDLSLNVTPGSRIAIVGPTGCGKTTLINLLMRFYDTDAGSISVDGTDIRDLRRASLRRSFGMVLQDTWLMNGTVRDNIAFGKPDASDDEIVSAARDAHADSFIRRLPDGYDTVIGEDGGSLSQGQKQLLCIARVMLCRPPMLILDEATSSIDTRTELKVQKAFDKLMEGRTSFVVAHRLSTVRNADLILVMKDGSIIERGTHNELLERKGFYYELYNSQFVS